MTIFNTPAWTGFQWPAFGDWDRMRSDMERTLRGLPDGFFSHVDDFFSGFVSGLFDMGVGREKDLYYEVILTVQEASTGGLFPLTVPVIEPCPSCQKPMDRDIFFAWNVAVTGPCAGSGLFP
jgi:DnaJ-class molecular chaperone